MKQLDEYALSPNGELPAGTQDLLDHILYVIEKHTHGYEVGKAWYLRLKQGRMPQRYQDANAASASLRRDLLVSQRSGNVAEGGRGSGPRTRRRGRGRGGTTES